MTPSAWRRRTAWPPAPTCPRECGSRTMASAASTWPTSCSRVTTRWSSLTPCRWARRPGREPQLVQGPSAGSEPDSHPVDAHTMSPDVVLATLARLGGSVGRVVIVGCQPADLREGMGLTPAVQDAVDAAVDLCLEVVADVALSHANAQPAERGSH